jgi:hypothetical protein
MAGKNCDLLSLSVADLDKMRIEFPDIYLELHKHSRQEYKFHLEKKQEQIDLEIKAKDENTKFTALFFKSPVGAPLPLCKNTEENDKSSEEGDGASKGETHK